MIKRESSKIFFLLFQWNWFNTIMKQVTITYNFLHSQIIGTYKGSSSYPNFWCIWHFFEQKSSWCVSSCNTLVNKCIPYWLSPFLLMRWSRSPHFYLRNAKLRPDILRSSHLEASFEPAALNHFTKFSGNHKWWSCFLRQN